MIQTTFFCFLLATACFSQGVLPIPVNHQRAFARKSRDLNGLPGKNYWQNSGDYQIKVAFDPSSRILTGHVSIRYFNNSPDTLKKIQFKLYPNLYQAGAVRTMPINRKDLSNGVTIKGVSIGGEPVNLNRLVTRGTNMHVRDCMILPGDTADVDVAYAYTLNQGSFIRTGQIDPGSFFIAYFFPRIAVYDDIDGWNEYPYTGREEFYNDYGNFTCEITVPADYVVWSTGDLVNASDVLTERILARIDSATRYDNVVDVIADADIAAKGITKNKDKHTWIFQADHVPDIAFAISNHFVWKSTSVLVDSLTRRRTRVDAVYDPLHKKFEPILDHARRTVFIMSHQFPRFPFPYPHQTMVEGLDAMEYPMMVNYRLTDDEVQSAELTAHEIFHALFPFYVGFNETKYSFMDEGLATLSEFTLHHSIIPALPLRYDIGPVNETAGSDFDVPIITLTPQLTGKARYSNKDLKPALGFHYVKEMLGDEKFSAALRYVITHWEGKHPQPYDFFNCMNQGAGVNLNWFWKDWFYNKVAPDLAISKVVRKGSQDMIEIRKVGMGMVPIHLTLYYSDGTTETRSSDIRCWSKGNDFVVFKGKQNKIIQQIKLGNKFDVDIDKSNNFWRK
jgi:hypothetical protein